MIALLLAGALLLCGGAVAILFGIPVKEFSVGNTLILSGAVVGSTGVLLIGIGLVVRELKLLGQRLETVGLGHAERSDLVVATVPQPASEPAKPVRPAARAPGNSDFLFSRDDPHDSPSLDELDVPLPPLQPTTPSPQPAPPSIQQPIQQSWDETPEPEPPLPRPARDRTRELVTRDGLPREPLSREPLPREPLSRERLPRDPSPRDLLSRDPLPREPASREPLTREPSRSRAPLPARPERTEAPSAEKPARRDVLFQSRRRTATEQAVSRDTDRGPGAASTLSSIEPPLFDSTWPPEDTHSEPEFTPEPAPSRARPSSRFPAPRRAPASEVTVVQSGVVDTMAYSLYSDGSIEAQLPEGTVRFESIEELRAHLDQRGA